MNGGIKDFIFKAVGGLIVAFLVASSARVWYTREVDHTAILTNSAAIQVNQLAILRNQSSIEKLERRLEKHEDAKAHPEALAALAAIEARLNAQAMRERQ